MNTDEYFQNEAVIDALTRAAGSLCLPVSVHVIDDSQVFSSGRCEACRHVATLAWGKKTCSQSRKLAAEQSLTREKPVPFLCHMGFSCVAMAALTDSDEPCTITVGPFCPDETPDSLEQDALKGLKSLDRTKRDELPFELDDIRRIPAASVPESAEWIAATMASLWKELEDSTPETPDEIEDEETSKTARRRLRLKTDPYGGSAIAAALAAQDLTQTRAMVKEVIAHAVPPRKRNVAILRARAMATAAATLEAAATAGLDTEKSWERFADLGQAVESATTVNELAKAVMNALRPLTSTAGGQTEDQKFYEELRDRVQARLLEGVTLTEIAKAMSVKPSTITRRLQRKLGFSFGEYIGQLRVAQARHLFGSTDLPVKEVARRVGLNDAGNFSKLFRKHEGMSPTAYCNRFGKKS